MIALARVQTHIGDLNASGELPAEVRVTMGVVDRTTEDEDLMAAAYQAAYQVRGAAGAIG